MAAVAAVLPVAAVLIVQGSAHGAPSDAGLAYRWAPIHYQDTAASDSTADYLGPVDYDGDWDTQDNWEDLPGHSGNLVGTVYYSVAETATHWFLVYAFYHPRDWKLSNPHENDVEGLLEVVRKDGSEFGTLEAIVTLAHDNFYSFLPPGSPYTAGEEDVDGSVIMQDYAGAAHPTSLQEAKGHGCKAWSGGGFPGGDGVVYYPSQGGGRVPASGNDRAAAYQLVDIFAAGGLWDRRSDPQTFAAPGTLVGDNGQDNAAHLPWAWDDWDDGSPTGEPAADPAALVADYFGNLGQFATSYLRNAYR
jgi:hypothetical protein